MTGFKLSDLVMMQMIGGLDRFNHALLSGGNLEEIIESVRKKATTPNLFSEIVRKTIEAQFSDPSTVLRELGQNARDSYSFEETPKIIEFSTKLENGRIILSAKDYGIGMQPMDVVKNLLIPYNSGKELDVTKIGEHGIGWFSVMDVSERIEVLTRNGVGKTTYVTLTKDNGDWHVNLDLNDNPFKGTEVIMHIDNSKLDDLTISNGLTKHLGFSNSSEVNLTLNGEKKNTLDQNYIIAGESLISNKGVDAILRLGMSKEKMISQDAITLTQEGFYVKDMNNPFDKNSLHYEFLNKLRSFGIGFWVDLPINVGLTKGRNNIVASDVEKITSSLYPAFEQAILNVVLEDEKLVKCLDHQISEILEKIFNETYNITKISIARRLREGFYDFKDSVRRLYSRMLTSTSSSTYNKTTSTKISVVKNTGTVYKFENLTTIVLSNDVGKDYFLEIPYPKKSKIELKAEERAREYLSKITGLSKAMITKKFIPAIIVDKEKRTFANKVSVQDLIAAYELNSLYLYRPIILDNRSGIYVDSNNKVARTIMDRLSKNLTELEKYYMERAIARKRKNEAPQIADTSTLDAPKITVKKPNELPENETKIKPRFFNRTGRNTLSKIVTNECCGSEYLALIDIAEYFDILISKANEINRSYFAIHNKDYNFEKDVAHTNKYGISFNISSRPVELNLCKLRSGEVNTAFLDSMLEIGLHEKAHCITELYDYHGTHGKDFYEEKKKILRDNLIEYLMTNKIDPLSDVTQILKNTPKTEPLQDEIKLCEYIQKYTK